MRVTGWTSWDNPAFQEMFPDGGRYSAEEDNEVRKLIARELRKNGYKFTGQYHQNGDFGVPIIDNEKVYQCSQRTWGEIMVMAYPDDPNNPNYCSWAWETHKVGESVLPNTLCGRMREIPETTSIDDSLVDYGEWMSQPILQKHRQLLGKLIRDRVCGVFYDESEGFTIQECCDDWFVHTLTSEECFELSEMFKEIATCLNEK